MTDTPFNAESQKAAIEAAKKATAECYPSISLDIMENIVRRAVRAALPAYLAAEAERGWAMRPEDPSEAMKQSGNEINSAFKITTGKEAPVENLWVAMWDAAAKDQSHD